MLTGGFFRVSREVLEWELIDDPKALAVLFRLFATVNYKPQKWRGITIETGQRVISYEKFADEVGIPKTTLIGILDRMDKTGVTDRKPTAKYTIITVKKYIYLDETRPLTDRKPTADRPLTDLMEEGKERIRKKYGKKEGGSKAPAHPPLTPEEKIAFVLEWGEDNVNRYIGKIKKWKISQGREPEVDAEILDRWLREDYAKGLIKKPSECGGGSFNIDDLERSSYDRYRKGK